MKKFIPIIIVTVGVIGLFVIYNLDFDHKRTLFQENEWMRVEIDCLTENGSRKCSVVMGSGDDWCGRGVSVEGDDFTILCNGLPIVKAISKSDYTGSSYTKFQTDVKKN